MKRAVPDIFGKIAPRVAEHGRFNLRTSASIYCSKRRSRKRLARGVYNNFEQMGTSSVDSWAWMAFLSRVDALLAAMTTAACLSGIHCARVARTRKKDVTDRRRKVHIALHGHISVEYTSSLPSLSLHSLTGRLLCYPSSHIHRAGVSSTS